MIFGDPRSVSISPFSFYPNTVVPFYISNLLPISPDFSRILHLLTSEKQVWILSCIQTNLEKKRKILLSCHFSVHKYLGWPLINSFRFLTKASESQYSVST